MVAPPLARQTYYCHRPPRCHPTPPTRPVVHRCRHCCYLTRRYCPQRPRRWGHRYCYHRHCYLRRRRRRHRHRRHRRRHALATTTAAAGGNEAVPEASAAGTVVPPAPRRRLLARQQQQQPPRLRTGVTPPPCLRTGYRWRQAWAWAHRRLPSLLVLLLLVFQQPLLLLLTVVALLSVAFLALTLSLQVPTQLQVLPLPHRHRRHCRQRLRWVPHTATLRQASGRRRLPPLCRVCVDGGVSRRQPQQYSTVPRGGNAQRVVGTGGAASHTRRLHQHPRVVVGLVSVPTVRVHLLPPTAVAAIQPLPLRPLQVPPIYQQNRVSLSQCRCCQVLPDSGVPLSPVACCQQPPTLDDGQRHDSWQLGGGVLKGSERRDSSPPRR